MPRHHFLIEVTHPGQPQNPPRFYSRVQESIVLGKHPDCDVVLAEEGVSRNHCRLRVTDQGVAGKDLQSTNGTFIDGQKLQEFLLKFPGDAFQIGAFRIRVVRLETDAPCFSSQQGVALLYDTHRDFIRETDTQILSNDDRTRIALKIFLEHRDPQLPLWCSRWQLHRRLTDEIIGLGPIESHLRDPEVTEIMVNGCDAIYIERAGTLQRIDQRFINNDSVLHCVQKIINPLGRRLDDQSPLVDARINTTGLGNARLNAIISPLSLMGPCLTIRKSTCDALDMPGLIQGGSLTLEAAEFLKYSVRSHRNMVIAGGTGSGKTTLLNILSQEIEFKERIITIEDTAELRLRQPHIVALEARPKNLEGQGEVTIRDLVKNALRMRPDRIVIGECRGGETIDMLQAMNTGHDGSLTTLHANSPRDSLGRLETMCAMAGYDLPLKAIREQIVSALDLVVYLERLRSGKRVVTYITEVCHLEGDTITLQDIFVYNLKRGSITPTGIIPTFLDGQAAILACFQGTIHAA